MEGVYEVDGLKVFRRIVILNGVRMGNDNYVVVINRIFEAVSIVRIATFVGHYQISFKVVNSVI